MRTKSQVLSFMSLGHFLHHVQLYTFPALLILMLEDFDLSYLEIGILGTLPVIVMALASPLIGYYGKDAKTGVGIVILGIFLFALASSILAISSDFFWLFGGNLLLGLGCMTYHPIGLGITANSYEAEERGKAMAINHAAGVIGTAISPVATLGVTLFFLKSWRITYFLLGIIYVLIGIIMIIWLLSQQLILEYQELENQINRETPITEETAEDQNGISPTLKWILLLLGLILFISALRGAVYRCLSYFTTVLLKDFYGVSVFEAGLWTSVVLIAGSISDVSGAIISDEYGHMGRIKIVLLSNSATALAILLVILLTENMKILWIVVLGFSLFAIAFYLAGGTLQALMSDFVPSEHRTVLYSVVFSLGLIISSVSPIIFGWLLDTYQSPVAGFIFLLILILMAFVVTLIVNSLFKSKNIKEESLSNGITS